MFNLPAWQSLAYPTSTPADSRVTLGPGVRRASGRLLEVTDPAASYLEVHTAVRPVGFVRVLSAPVVRHVTTVIDPGPQNTVHVRLDLLDSPGDTRAARWAVGRAESLTAWVPRSQYLKNQTGTRSSGTVRLWVQEPRGTEVALTGMQVNARVPPGVDWIRIAAMATLAALILAMRPRSSLWRTRLRTADRCQRLAFAVLMLPLVALAVMMTINSIRSFEHLEFHRSSDYTYDFDQYAYLADALLHGRPWLDLPVPEQLAAAPDPWSVATRERLLSEGVSPIYWDYVFFAGRWYSYFGVIPAVLLYVPYQAVSSLWTPGGAILPTAAAVAVLLGAAGIFGALLTVRLLRRFFPRTSVATALLSIIVTLLGSNLAYLWLRPNVYAVPMAASMLVTWAGLWFWLGARRTPGPLGVRSRPWTADDPPVTAITLHTARPDPRRDEDAPRSSTTLSLSRVAAGSLLLAANLGCRQTFVAFALLGFPIFWNELTALTRGLAARTLPARRAATVLAAVLIPALTVVLPLLWYNHWRFGSWLNFGNRYQMTVTDLTRYHEPLALLPRIVGYYLFLPMRFTSRFPYLAMSPTPLPHWQYTNPMAAGLFIITPVLITVFAVPWLRRTLMRQLAWDMTLCLLALAAFMLTFTSYEAGLDWRYFTDFSGLTALGAVLATAAMLQAVPIGESAARRHPAWLIRAALLALLIASLVATVMGLLAPGRPDALIDTNTSLYFTFKSWFVLLE